MHTIVPATLVFDFVAYAWVGNGSEMERARRNDRLPSPFYAALTNPTPTPVASPAAPTPRQDAQWACAAAEVVFRRIVADADMLFLGIPGTDPSGPYATSLCRAVVVLCAAAWEAYVETLIRSLVRIDELQPLEPLEAAIPRMTDLYSYGLRQHQILVRKVEKEIKRFHTPSSKNTMDLFKEIEFSPEWRFAHGGELLTPGVARATLDGWLDMRHAIAHGGQMGAVTTGPANLQRSGGDAEPTRDDAGACLAFFKALVANTSSQALATL